MGGVNEAMFGQQSREQSGFSMQYATNQGNMIRLRLFNKYVALVESVWKAYLNLVRKYWEESRTIYVLGQEKAFEAYDIKGADINGGFDLVVEYGTSLPLDPVTRRQDILQLMPFLEKANVNARTILRMLKLSDLEGLQDLTQLGYDRQAEIIQQMIKTGQYVAPRQHQDHVTMLEFLGQYVMTAEFNNLSEEIKQLIEKQIEDRQLLAAPPAPPAGPMGAPGPAAPGGPGSIPLPPPPPPGPRG